MASTTTIDPKVIETVKAEHPGEDLHLIETNETAAIFRTPSSKVYNRFVEELAQEGQRIQAFRSLIVGSLVYPEKEAFFAALEREPGALTVIGTKLTKIAGASQEARHTKL